MGSSFVIIWDKSVKFINNRQIINVLTASCGGFYIERKTSKNIEKKGIVYYTSNSCIFLARKALIKWLK
jgi:hypothetical protein